MSQLSKQEVLSSFCYHACIQTLVAGGYGLQRLVVPWVREYYERWAAARQNDGGSAAGGKRAGKALTAEEQGSASALADAIRVRPWVRARIASRCAGTVSLSHTVHRGSAQLRSLLVSLLRMAPDDLAAVR